MVAASASSTTSRQIPGRDRDVAAAIPDVVRDLEAASTRIALARRSRPALLPRGNRPADARRLRALGYLDDAH